MEHYPEVEGQGFEVSLWLAQTNDEQSVSIRKGIASKARDNLVGFQGTHVEGGEYSVRRVEGWLGRKPV